MSWIVALTAPPQDHFEGRWSGQKSGGLSGAGHASVLQWKGKDHEKGLNFEYGCTDTVGTRIWGFDLKPGGLLNWFTLKMRVDWPVEIAKT